MKNNIFGYCRVAVAAFFVALSSVALAQNAGTVTQNAFAIGLGAGKQGYASLLCGSAQLAVGQSAAAPICKTITGDVTITAAGVTAIGASKVANSQLATMGANTTKCNATAGTANPTDCNAATMKNNLGLVIGTNVEAWDTDLDCLAALSSTGVIKRTGAGTCSAGTVALTDLATGTQDTVIGYFGSTAASALAIGNCSNALTYSTSTHTFGCNTTAGTGTVTTTGTPTANQTAVMSGSTSVTGVGPGTLGQALISQGSGSNPTYVSGSRNLLATLSGTGVATLSDTTHITSSFNDYDLVFENVLCASGNQTLELQVNAGGVQSTGYLSTALIGGNGVAAVQNVTTFVPVSASSSVQGTGAGLSGTVTIFNATATNAPKNIAGQTSAYNGVIWNPVSIAGGWNGGNAAISGFQVLCSAGNITGSIKIYGRL